jgi:uncharacterized delta-60 repeat protein
MKKGNVMNEVGVLNHASVVGRQVLAQRSKSNPGTIVRRVLLACAALIVSSSPAMAQAGKLDPTFGVGGVFTNRAGILGAVAAVQSNGKIIVGGEISPEAAVVRLNANGTLDSTFGAGGAVSISFPGDDFSGAQVIGLAIQSDGKIVAAISNFQQGFGPVFILARLNVNGSLDTTFGTGGIVETQVGPSGGSFGAVASVLALQPDGKILVAGQNSELTGASGAVARYDTDGQLDGTFGSGGVAVTSIAAPTTIALQPDGKILLAGGGNVVGFAYAAPPVSPAQIAGIVSRYNANGSLDTSFGISGQAASVVVAGAIVVQTQGGCSSDCKILVAGTVVTSMSVNNGNGFGFGLVRYNSNGSVDSTFGQAGAVATSFTPTEPDATPFALAIQANGDIIEAGAAGKPGGNPAFVTPADFALARYTSNGVLDTTFGSAGKVTTAFGNSQASIYALALQSDGKIVAVGTSIARYLAQ